MRFGVSRVLDVIEQRLTLDPALARGVLDLAEVVRLTDLDGDSGKPATLLRLGHVIDAFGAHLGEGSVAVYVVVGRALLSDLDLTSNERMVVRRWADDGLVEVLAEPGDRVLELAEMLSVPVLTRRSYQQFAGRFRWLPGGLLAPGPAGMSQLGNGAPVSAQAPAWVARMWRCPEPGCVSFGVPDGSQPPPRVRSGSPVCPRHETRLVDAGRRPRARVLAVRVDGAVRCRFVVREATPVTVGRSPSHGVGLGPLLGEEAMRWISRSHLRLELRGDALVIVDTSTNGTTVRGPAGPVKLPAGQVRGVGPDEVIELYAGVEIAPPSRFRSAPAQLASVMSEAPTVSMRLR